MAVTELLHFEEPLSTLRFSVSRSSIIPLRLASRLIALGPSPRRATSRNYDRWLSACLSTGVDHGGDPCPAYVPRHPGPTSGPLTAGPDVRLSRAPTKRSTNDGSQRRGERSSSPGDVDHRITSPHRGRRRPDQRPLRVHRKGDVVSRRAWSVGRPRREGELVWSGAFGFADLAAGRPMQTDWYSSRLDGQDVHRDSDHATRRAGSGRSRPADRQAAAFPGREPSGGEITVRHLMTHTSGIGTTLVDCCTSPQTRPLAELLADYVQRESDGTFGGETTHLARPCRRQLVLLEPRHRLARADCRRQQRPRPDVLRLHPAAHHGSTGHGIRCLSAGPGGARRATGNLEAPDDRPHGSGRRNVSAPSIYFQVFPAGAFVSTASDHYGW